MTAGRINRFIMFGFLQKKFLWEALDSGLLGELDQKLSYQLKTAQDLWAYSALRNCRGMRIAEIGGGDSRILRKLAQSNQCFNIEKFEGRNAGPGREIAIEGVENILSYVGSFDSSIPSESFDVIFSISVVEHIDNESIGDFRKDALRMLKIGGVFYHAIDMYIQNEPTDYASSRMDSYLKFLTEDGNVEPLEPIAKREAKFETSMVSNPDNILHSWNLYAPHLSELRQVSQNVCLVVGGRRVE